MWPVLALLSAMSASATIRSLSPEERPITVATQPGELIVEMDRGSIAHFYLDDAMTVTRVEVRVGDRQVSADLRSCASLRSIHTGDMKLIRDDLREDEHRTDALTLFFRRWTRGRPRIRKAPSRSAQLGRGGIERSSHLPSVGRESWILIAAMYEMNKKTTILRLALRWLEFLLFVAAFAFIVPPIPSIDGQTYSLAPTLVIGGALLSASLCLTIYRKADSIFFSALTVVFYLGLAWVIHERVWSY